MAETLLNRVINGDIKRGALFDWLNGKSEQDQFGCSQGEFLSHFLNYVHEKAPCFDKSNDTPHKVHTPKSIRKLQMSKSETKPRRRTNLFPEPNHNMNDSLSEIEARIGGKSLLHDLNTSRETSFANPLSPIYARPNTSTPRARNRPSDDKSFCLGDFITYSRKSSSKSQRNSSVASENVEPKRSRRINPTNLNKKFSHLFSGTENSYNFKDSTEEIQADSVVNQRNLLAAERLKISSRKLDEPPLPIKAINQITPATSGTEIIPDPILITHKGKLDCLIEIYVYLLNHSLILNVTSEMYFLLSLALTKQYETNSVVDEDSARIFDTIHNTFYFAISVLESQVKILKLLEKSCLRFLCANERLRALCGRLVDSGPVCREKSESPVKNECGKESQVCFMSDTDNRENFPSDPSFHAFRKQRDLFYEILRIWEQNRFQDGWNFVIGLGGKIKTLFSLHGDAANFRHFCRLFKQQLLATCSNSNEQGMSECELPFLSSIPNINSEKLSRLRSRLVTKTSTNGINALPTFPGYQEFYKEFIVTASMHTFNVHLKNALVQDILELNESKFSSNELDEQDTQVDVETKTSYLTCLQSLRLLAKFLGFLDSVPYRMQTNAPDKVISAEIKTRIWEQPIFDLKQLLERSYSNSTLTITIPWITKYLSMLDFVTLRLPYFEKIYNVLFEVFYSAPDKRRSFAANMLIKLCVGWLLELPHFPSEFYFTWCTKRITGTSCDRVEVKWESSLDSLDIVDKDVIYACCPYLNEFKRLLQYNCAKNGSISVKHITPISAVESPVQINEKRLRLQLEEAFFTGHPTSLRKTVEFVSERVASACVKNICSNIVPQKKAEAIAEFKIELREICSDKEIDSKIGAELRAKCNEFMHDRLKSLQHSCTSELERQISVKICDTINLLLSDEEMQQTKDTCATIASRTCKERVQVWINTHINEGLLSKDLDSELMKTIQGHSVREQKNKLVFSMPTLGNNSEHNPDTWSPATVVDRIRNLCVETLEKSTHLNALRLTETLDSITDALKYRCDVNECIFSLINKMLIDLLILIITYKTEICDGELLSKFLSFWKDESGHCANLFKTIICPRNITILNQSPNRRSSWDKFSEFVLYLLQQQILDCETFESQCLAIYRQDWNKEILKQLSTCFQNVADKYNKQPYSRCEFAFLLSYLSDFCSDLEL